jgi:signal transduction histidine kinase
VTGELPNAFDEVGWHIEPAAAAEIQDLAPLSAEVLFGAAREVIRNAAGHGRGSDPARRLHLQVNIVYRDALTIEIEDDGVGLNAAAGVAEGGHGQGLALHSTLMAVVGGSLSIESRPDAYTRVSLTLPQPIWESEHTLQRTPAKRPCAT